MHPILISSYNTLSFPVIERLRTEKNFLNNSEKMFKCTLEERNLSIKTTDIYQKLSSFILKQKNFFKHLLSSAVKLYLCTQFQSIIGNKISTLFCYLRRKELHTAFNITFCNRLILILPFLVH